MDCNDYKGISLSSTPYKILSNILLAGTPPYAIIGKYQCGFRRNRLTTNPIFSIQQILDKKWEYNNEVCHLFKNRPNYFGYKVQTTKLQKILAMLGAIPVECSGKRSVIT